MLPMLAAEPATTSAIVAALNPLVANTSVAASRIRCWVAPVLAQRRACAEGALPRRYRVCRPPPEFARLSAARLGVGAVSVLENHWCSDYFDNSPEGSVRPGLVRVRLVRADAPNRE